MGFASHRGRRLIAIATNRANLFLTLAIALSSGCMMQQRSNQLIANADDLLVTTKEVLGIMRSIQDAPTAQAAIPKLKEKYPLMLTQVSDIGRNGKAADNAGGITRNGAETLKQRMATYQSLMLEMNSEQMRL